MNHFPFKLTLWIILFSMAHSSPVSAGLRDKGSEADAGAPVRSESHRSVTSDTVPDPEDLYTQETSNQRRETAPKPKSNRGAVNVQRADAFVAGADWEFDGFVSGGQDQNVRTMFYQGDLVYLNIGSQHGLHSGDRVAIYKRGDRIRDPQSGKFIGYEVRRAAYGEASDRVDLETCSIRIVKTFEQVEIGDLVRKEESPD